MWSSVLFYKVPETEVTACVLLSTKAMYFLLDNSVAQSHEHHLGKTGQIDSWLLIKFARNTSEIGCVVCF